MLQLLAPLLAFNFDTQGSRIADQFFTTMYLYCDWNLQITADLVRFDDSFQLLPSMGFNSEPMDRLLRHRNQRKKWGWLKFGWMICWRHEPIKSHILSGLRIRSTLVQTIRPKCSSRYQRSELFEVDLGQFHAMLFWSCDSTRNHNFAARSYWKASSCRAHNLLDWPLQ